MTVEYFSQKLNDWKNAALIRRRYPFSDRKANLIKYQSKTYLNFSSNDYLGLENHPDIKESIQQGVEKYGFGSSASCLVSGYSQMHEAVENQFSEWLGVDRTLLFSSGYHANLGVITSFATRQNTIFSDKFCHASILDGIQLSRAKHFRYAHNNISHLSNLCLRHKPDFLITESVFSMEGDIAPISQLVELAQTHHAGLILDDAHGIGVLGQKGKGILEYAKIHPSQITCLILPLGKAFNGMGGMVAGQSEIIEHILQFARSYRYTTGLPPAVCSGLLASLKLVSQEAWRREKLQENIFNFNQSAQKQGLALISSEPTPIRSINLKDNKLVLKVQEGLLEDGFYVSAIRPPTVPQNTARIRISLNALHSKKQIDYLIERILYHRS